MFIKTGHPSALAVVLNTHLQSPNALIWKLKAHTPVKLFEGQLKLTGMLARLKRTKGKPNSQIIGLQINGRVFVTRDAFGQHVGEEKLAEGVSTGMKGSTPTCCGDEPLCSGQIQHTSRIASRQSQNNEVPFVAEHTIGVFHWEWALIVPQTGDMNTRKKLTSNSDIKTLLGVQMMEGRVAEFRST